MKKETQKSYKAALYLRLSVQKLGEEQTESDSIANQEALLRSFLKSYPDIKIKKVFKDDGFSGVSFDRPAFQKMMQMVYDNEIDCIVVKDLSRLGRNHTETGKYITRVFPAFGVRFIAVTDHIDTANSNSDAENFIIPFKDLLNDSYSRDISVKVRTALAVQRAEGKFGGAFYPYGYEIDPKDCNKYIIDEEAADVIRKIFRWTFDGIGSTEIARRLNMMKIPSPMEYKRKKKLGEKYVPGERPWNIFQVYRILRNDTYIGVLRLGRLTTPNYKVKKVIEKPEDEWCVFPDHHEAIIPKHEFDLMQDVLNRDSRSSKKATCKKAHGVYSNMYPLVGYIYCADCGGAMHVKTSNAKGHSYRYYVCGVNKNDSSVCSTHTVAYEKVIETVLCALNMHLRTLFDFDEAIQKRALASLTQPAIEKLQIKIGQMLEEKYALTKQEAALDKDLYEGILSEREYWELKADYKSRIEQIEKDAAELEIQKNNQVASQENNIYWINKYKEGGELTDLSRRDVITFIDRVEVKDEDHITITFRFGDEYKRVLRMARRFRTEEEQKNAEEGMVAVNG